MSGADERGTREKGRFPGAWFQGTGDKGLEISVVFHVQCTKNKELIAHNITHNS